MSGSILDQIKQFQEAAKRKAQELDDKYDLKSKIEEGITTAGETVREVTETAREQFTKIDEQYRVTENLKSGVAQSGVDEAARAAEEKAREIFGMARDYYQRAEQSYRFTSQTAGVGGAIVDGYDKARRWMIDNPGKASLVTLSLLAGVRSGSSLSSLGVTLLGSAGSGHWFFHSALPVVGLRKLTEKYQEYLRSQEVLLAEGRLDEAERDRLEFQQKATKYVGAPLLGAFSIAAGATLIGAAFSGATLNGFPVNLVLGGNPLLNGIWFFANGVICISEGYRFFMIALADEVEVERVVREVRGLLTA
jgi:hypothetical protein